MQQFQPFSSTLLFTSHTTPSIHTLNNHGDSTLSCLINYNWKPLIHIHSYPDTGPTEQQNSALLSTISLQLLTLLASATYHDNQSYNMPLPTPQMSKNLSHLIDTFDTPASQQHLTHAPSTLPKTTLLLPYYTCIFTSFNHHSLHSLPTILHKLNTDEK